MPQIVVTPEEEQVVSIIDLGTGHIV